MAIKESGYGRGKPQECIFRLNKVILNGTIGRGGYGFVQFHHGFIEDLRDRVEEGGGVDAASLAEEKVIHILIECFRDVFRNDSRVHLELGTPIAWIRRNSKRERDVKSETNISAIKTDMNKLKELKIQAMEMQSKAKTITKRAVQPHNIAEPMIPNIQTATITEKTNKIMM